MHEANRLLTVAIPAEQHQALKQLAVSQDTTMRRLVMSAITTLIDKPNRRPAGKGKRS